MGVCVCVWGGGGGGGGGVGTSNPQTGANETKAGEEVGEAKRRVAGDIGSDTVETMPHTLTPPAAHTLTDTDTDAETDTEEHTMQADTHRQTVFVLVAP